MTLQMRHFFSARWMVSGLALALLVAPAAAQAQDQGVATLAVADPAQTQNAPRAQQPPGARDPYWASIGGYEVDSHDTGYGFFGPQYIRPIRPNVSFVGSANVNYLHYEFANAAGGHTNVRSPGVSTMAGVMFGTRNWFLVQAGPSFKQRHVRMLDAADSVIATDKDFKVGFNVGTSAWIDPTSHNNVFAMYNYETVDKYHWGRVAFKEQIANRSFQGNWTPYLGVEYIGQGNQDIRSNQYGGFVEMAHGPSSVSVMFRAGWKRSTFDFGPPNTGPWFAIGFYHRL
jgi:hypothetical protein